MQKEIHTPINKLLIACKGESVFLFYEEDRLLGTVFVDGKKLSKPNDYRDGSIEELMNACKTYHQKMKLIIEEDEIDKRRMLLELAQ